MQEAKESVTKEKEDLTTEVFDDYEFDDSFEEYYTYAFIMFVVIIVAAVFLTHLCKIKNLPPSLATSLTTVSTTSWIICHRLVHLCPIYFIHVPSFYVQFVNFKYTPILARRFCISFNETNSNHHSLEWLGAVPSGDSQLFQWLCLLDKFCIFCPAVRGLKIPLPINSSLIEAIT